MSRIYPKQSNVAKLRSKLTKFTLITDLNICFGLFWSNTYSWNSSGAWSDFPIGAEIVTLEINCLSLVKTKSKRNDVWPLRNLVGLVTSWVRFEFMTKSTNKDAPSVVSDGLIRDQWILGKLKSPAIIKFEVSLFREESAFTKCMSSKYDVIAGR